MANARRGLYIRVGYSVFRDGIPEDLASVTALTVIFRHICQPNSSVMYTAEKLSTYANTVSATITDADQVKLMSGDYKIEVYYRRANPANESGYEPYVIDAPVFTLTDTSTEVNETTCGDITIQTINLAGEVSFCSEELEALILESKQAITDAEAATQAANDAAAAAMAIVDSKIDLDGLNSNIRQLKFNTATPVAPTQAGQMAWSDEEKTGVLHNGYHGHPVGKETFFTAKNQSGTLIANGKAVYVIGSTGANATIGLATTANGDIAQRTIGIATMDIASNGFGDVTTFGEVNDINTSALTEGALVYLGLNGNLTSVEPVAPTPKISLGLCIRSHLTQGRIAVYVRPIARLNRLTDVYAPNLLDGDVLRWNGTALRYEVYNLVNKADLVGGKVPASQLPAYVDDILEYANLAAFPLVGETSKLYVTLDTNLTYRWSGSAYTEVSKSLAIGITNTTAFRGDWGKIAYDHSQLTNSNPHGTTAAQIANTPAGTISATTVQAAINELDADRVQLETDLNYMYPSVGTAKRILVDSGTIKSRSTLNDLTNKFLDLLPNTKLLFCPHLAVKLRESGIYKYVTKLYDVAPAMMDGAQTTALNQPYLSGNVAPNEKYALKNPNGGNSYITHTPISFSATDKWSVSTMLNDFCSSLADYGAYCGNGATASNIYLRKSSANRLRFLSNSSVEYLFNVNNSLIGKNSLITFVSFGNGTLNLYLNGKLFQSISSTDTSFIFSRILNSYSTLGLNGDIRYHCIRGIALSTTQVQDEYNYLRLLFQEIESVQIGTQTWATNNCEITCTPQGNVIPEMQAATNVEKITNVADREFSSDTGFWTKLSDWTISEGVANCSGNLTTTYIRAKGKVSISKWYKVSVNVVITSGNVNYITGNAGYQKPLINGLNSFYIFHNGSSGDIVFQGISNFVGSIDNVSVQEVGWSDSTNLYNSIYSSTVGTAEQKEYAAVKAASMWRNVNNDTALASIYGKKFNKYAKRLLAMDIAYYNAANPTALWGWDIPTQAQLTTLASNGGNALKVGGTNYWNTANGINSTGLTLLGGGYIDASGNYVGNKTHEGVWCKDADVARVALDADNSFNEVAATTEGYSIRLIKV